MQDWASVFNTSLWSFPWCPLIIWFNLLKCLQLLIWSNLFQKNSHASENYYIHPTPLWGLVFKNLCSKVVHQSIDCNSQIGHNSVKMKYFEIWFFFFFFWQNRDGFAPINIIALWTLWTDHVKSQHLCPTKQAFYLFCKRVINHGANTNSNYFQIVSWVDIRPSILCT